MAAPILLGIGRLALGLGRVASRSLGSLRIKSTGSGASQRMQKLSKQFEEIPVKAHQYFRDKTPKDTGNARKNTKLEGTTIHADYAYATSLDQGYSRKAPQGMSKQTIAYVRRLIKQSAR